MKQLKIVFLLGCLSCASPFLAMEQPVLSPKERENIKQDINKRLQIIECCIENTRQADAIEHIESLSEMPENNDQEICLYIQDVKSQLFYYSLINGCLNVCDSEALKRHAVGAFRLVLTDRSCILAGKKRIEICKMLVERYQLPANIIEHWYGECIYHGVKNYLKTVMRQEIVLIDELKIALKEEKDLAEWRKLVESPDFTWALSHLDRRIRTALFEWLIEKNMIGLFNEIVDKGGEVPEEIRPEIMQKASSDMLKHFQKAKAEQLKRKQQQETSLNNNNNNSWPTNTLEDVADNQSLSKPLDLSAGTDAHVDQTHQPSNLSTSSLPAPATALDRLLLVVDATGVIIVGGACCYWLLKNKKNTNQAQVKSRVPESFLAISRGIH